MFNVNETISLCDFNDCKTVKEQMKSAYECIGDYIKDHSEELAAGMAENCQGVELKVVIQGNDVITLENKIIYYPTRKVEN
ncbi:MAG: hypothetical protein K0R54_2131 [Clostridiaceae bacterium]|jgi:hypothetical protein|nr:hypothetical protein [Clostridiaceae bacterium]